MRLYTICSKREYTVNDSKVIKWYRVGILSETDNGSKYIRMFSHPEQSYAVFEMQNEKELSQDA